MLTFLLVLLVLTTAVAVAVVMRDPDFVLVGIIGALFLMMISICGCAPAYAQRHNPVAGALGGAAVGAAAGAAGGAIAGDAGRGAAIGAVAGAIIIGLFGEGQDSYYDRPYYDYPSPPPQCYYQAQPYPYPPVLVCPRYQPPPVVIYPRQYYSPPPVIVIEPRRNCYRRGWGW